VSLMALCSAAVVIFNPAGYVSANGSQTPQKSEMQWGIMATMEAQLMD
jgi:hypothetical protein